MGFKDITSKVKNKVDTYQEGRAKAKAAEEARKAKINGGQIEPIAVTYQLRPGEQAYVFFEATKYAQVESTVQYTTGKSKKKGVVTRGIVGGVLLGPVGMVAGAATAGSKTSSTTTQKTTTDLKVVDKGYLVLTNERVLFNGTVLSEIAWPEIITYSVTGMKIELKYANMLPGEYYLVSGTYASDAGAYFTGIATHLIS